jgi:hypothetical protein
MMKRDELLAVVKSQLSNTIRDSNDDFLSVNRSLLSSYNQDPYGTEIEGRSQVVSDDHYAMVESDMPPFARIFLGSNKIMTFKPFGEQDKQEAEEKTAYAHYLIRGQRDSFKILFDFLKEPGMAKCSVIKFYPEETKKAEYVKYEGLSEDEMTVVLKDLESGDKVESVKVHEQDEYADDGGLKRYNVEFKVLKKTKRITLANVPVESFIITRGASDIKTAELVGDVCTKRKGQLVAEGFDKKMVKDLPVKGQSKNDLEQDRLKDQGGYDTKAGYHWTNDEVEIEYLYSLVDMDEDGVPERRLIVKCRDEILHEEPYGIEPYAVMSQIPMPHVLIGKSRGESAARTQLQRTAVERGLMDNLYSVLRPRMAIDDSAGSIEGGKVDLDDLMNDQIDGIIRVDGRPMEALMPITTPYIGNEALQVIQYLDSKKGQSLGNQAVTQGLNADQFYKETATRFEGVQDMGIAKLELVARVYAETGFRQLFEGVIWTAQHYQDDQCEVMVLGKQLTVDPRKWRYDHYCESNIGLGAGDSEESIANLGVTLQTQFQLMSAGSPLIDSQKIYNTLEDLTRAMGKPDASRYFNNPDMPQQQLLYMFEQALQQIQQLQAGIEQMGTQANSDAIRAETQIAIENNRANIKREENELKIDADMRKFFMKMAQDWQALQSQNLIKATELDLKYNGNPVDDIPGTLERN